MKRFYRDVAVQEAAGGFQVALDKRPIRTQGGAAQMVPTRALSDLLADEWTRQGEEIDPGSFPHRALADYAIDHVAHDRQAAADRLMRFLETDTLCYRADPDEPLHRRQLAEWEPVLTRFEARHGVRLVRVSGIVHRPQSAETLALLRERLLECDPFTLAAVETMASLAASLTVALETAEPKADAGSLWAAATLEEEWQAELWSREAEAETRRVRRRDEFMMAREFVGAARDDHSRSS